MPWHRFHHFRPKGVIKQQSDLDQDSAAFFGFALGVGKESDGSAD